MTEREKLDPIGQIQLTLRTISDQLKVFNQVVPELRKTATELRQIVLENTRRIEVLESQRPRHRDHSSYSDIDPERTPMGGIRLPPGMWDQFQSKLEVLQSRVDREESAKNLAEAQVRGADMAVTQLVRRLKLIVAIGGPIVGGIVGLVVHIFKL